MQALELTAGLIILINAVVSYMGFSDVSFQSKYAFRIDPILRGKEYIRLLSSGFLHVNWAHLLVNMLSLVFCARALDMFGIEVWEFLVIYFGSLFGGNILALYIHRNHGDYSAVGASGAVSGIVMAFVVMAPMLTIYLFFVIPMWAWVFGIAYILYSIYGVKTGVGRIGHDAHLGGAILGMLLITALRFAQVEMWVLALLLIPTIVFFYLMLTRPEILLIEGNWGLRRTQTKPPKYWSRNSSRASEQMQQEREERKTVSIRREKVLVEKKAMTKQEELDQLLDKVMELGGPDKLSKKDQARLNKLSKEL